MSTNIDATRYAEIGTLTFAQGAHAPTSGEMCVMEAAAYIANEPWSDQPQCVSPVIAAFLRSWNDALPEPPRTTLLRPLLPLVIGTRTNAADEQTRAWMATDWLVRVYTPVWMDLTPRLHESAQALRALPALTSSEIAVASMAVLSRTQKESAEARDAVRAEARAEAWAEARDAAWDAAWAAAQWAEARAALAPTVTTLQASAQQLVRDMCAVGAK